MSEAAVNEVGVDGTLEAIRAIVGPKGLLQGDDVGNRPDTWLGQGRCQAKAVVRPASTEEVSKVLRLCHQAGQTVVPQGGMTGLVGGASTRADDIVVSLERMTAIEELDPIGRTLTVQAGVPLQAVQEYVEQAGLMFALDLGARGSATIGGNIATNAGGNQVIRFGMMREQVLGLEAVLADGTVVSSLNTVIKNNAGYDVKQLFLGAEGTLGIVTRAVLRLRSRFRSQETALLAVAEFDELPRLLQTLDTALGGNLSAFEVMWNDFYRTVVGQNTEHHAPIEADHPYYVLVETLGADRERDRAHFQLALEAAFEEGLIANAVIAESTAQRESLWAIRDDIESLVAALRPLIAFDISLQIRQMQPYLTEVREQLASIWPGVRTVVFGHLGDGNLHLAVSVGDADQATRQRVDEIVYGALRTRGGSISAEHGIGLEKRPYLRYSRTESEIALMNILKQALDPKGILNPGKVLG